MLDESLREAAARQAPIWLALPAPARVEDVESWRAALGQLLDRHGAGLTILEVMIDDQPAPLAAFAVRLASTDARARTGAAIRVAIGGRRMESETSRSEVYTGDLTPYVDLLSIPAAEADRAACVAVTGGSHRRAGRDAGCGTRRRRDQADRGGRDPAIRGLEGRAVRLCGRRGAGPVASGGRVSRRAADARRHEPRRSGRVAAVVDRWSRRQRRFRTGCSSTTRRSAPFSRTGATGARTRSTSRFGSPSKAHRSCRTSWPAPSARSRDSPVMRRPAPHACARR